VCVLNSPERHYVFTVHCREELFVYCKVQSGTVWVMHNVERHCVCTAQCREAVCV